MTDPTNDDRADWAQQALDVFARATDMDTAGEDTETIMGDLLADILHLADREGIDIEMILDRAKSNFETEVAEERGYLIAPSDPYCANDGTCSCAKFGANPDTCDRKRPLGERSLCKHCDQDIEWTGDDWRDRGNGRQCLRHISGGEIVVPAEGQTHDPDKGWTRTVPVVQPIPIAVTAGYNCRYCGRTISKIGSMWFDFDGMSTCMNHVGTGLQHQPHEPQP